MGNVQTVARALGESFPEKSPNCLVELGAGDGTFALQLVRKLFPLWQSIEIILVDRHPAVTSETLEQFEALNCRVEVVMADVFEWLKPEQKVDAVFANLFLHHFEDNQLSDLLGLVSRRTSTFVACEPRRSGFAAAATHLLRGIGCNEITRHDATVSVHAGFCGREISNSWSDFEEWNLSESKVGLFSHLFAATKKSFSAG